MTKTSGGCSVAKPKDAPGTTVPNLQKGRRTKVGPEVDGLTRPRTVLRSRRNPGSDLEATLELADSVEQLAYEHGAGVVEPEVTA